MKTPVAAINSLHDYMMFSERITPSDFLMLGNYIVDANVEFGSSQLVIQPTMADFDNAYECMLVRRNLLKTANKVHIYWNPDQDSQLKFDLGMAFMLRKELRLVPESKVNIGGLDDVLLELSNNPALIQDNSKLEKNNVAVIYPMNELTPTNEHSINTYLTALAELKLKAYWHFEDSNLLFSQNIKYLTKIRKAIELADDVHMFWDPNSPFKEFDLGMIFAAQKPLFIPNYDTVENFNGFVEVINNLQNKYLARNDTEYKKLIMISHFLELSEISHED